MRRVVMRRILSTCASPYSAVVMFRSRPGGRIPSRIQCFTEAFATPVRAASSLSFTSASPLSCGPDWRVRGPRALHVARGGGAVGQ
ncbi:hypothetical protein A7J15_06845 [Microbacterium sediminis]|uniref:Uncharacterized protein n=1 Tax=Microbacterium sediminis TaxID=904291 RepID=A0A1B9NBD2_9MICO|nr:hypothetical protein A7J15_06845 [Microbacterium sediminis]